MLDVMEYAAFIPSVLYLVFYIVGGPILSIIECIKSKSLSELFSFFPAMLVSPIVATMLYLPSMLFIGVSYILPYNIMTIYLDMEETTSTYISLLIFSLIGIAIGFLFVKCRLHEKYKKKEEELQKDFDEKQKRLEEIERKIVACDKLRQMILESKEPFKKSASMIADAKVVIYNSAESYLRNKSRPSMKGAEVVSELKAKTREYISLYKQMQYKYEMLMSAFPILREYDEEDDEQSFIDMASSENLEEVSDNRDKARDFLSQEEWANLSVTERNQLAFDRWKSGKKSNWTIGMLYEMYAAHVLMRNAGAGVMQFDVIPYGINEGRADLGRDLIVKYKPTLFDRREPVTWIMQCKRWKTSRVIRENVICQLYGTTIEYRLKHKDEKKVIPMLVTTTGLSDIAKAFAEELGVVIKVLPYEDFPMIKCNINNGEKIYHLPFDQQYWRTDINKPGEFYAMTVAEAEAAGFRRAFRHFAGKA